MSEWRQVKLGDIAESITVGHVGPMADQYRPTGVPFLRSQNILPHRLDFNEVKYIGEEFHAQLRKSALRVGDVVTVRTGKPGATAVIPDGISDLNCADLVITRPGRLLDACWLSYYINSAASGFVSSRLVGAVQQHFNIGSAREMALLMPPLTEQQAIADVLVALDGKIAANAAMSRTGVKLADALFVQAVSRAGFSGYAFSDIAAVRGGGTPRTSVDEYWGGDVDWVTPTDVTLLEGPYLETTARRITRAGLDSCASDLYPAGSILMTSRATIGAFAVAQRPVAVNQGFIVVNPRESDLAWWVFHEMRDRVGEFLSYANGATFLELSRGNFKKLQVRLASQAEMKAFGIKANDLHRRSRAALVENDALATVRDALLPELMSGRLRVKDVEKKAGEVL